MTVGDKVYVKQDSRSLLFENASGESLGLVEPRLSLRLMELMRGGNRYAAALVSMDESGARVIIREVYQDPSQSGRVSFPTKGTEGPSIRPYIRDSLLRYGEEDDEEEEEGGFEGEAEAEGETEERAEEPEVEEEEGSSE